MPKKIVLSFLVVLLAGGLSACSVMQGTYQKKVDEVDTLTQRLAALQKQHDDLAAENAALKADLAEMTLQRDKLGTDLDYVTGGARSVAPGIVLSNSFAFGGNNTAVVFGRFRDEGTMHG